jgi:hypothetical protein
VAGRNEKAHLAVGLFFEADGGLSRNCGHRVTGDRQQNSDGAGWEFVHVAIDDACRIAFSSLHPDEHGRSACQALLQALRYYNGLGIRFTRVMTDNGSCYRSRKFRRLVRRLGLRHLRTHHFIAAAMLFLVSNQASYITGQTIIVDGGATLPETQAAPD